MKKEGLINLVEKIFQGEYGNDEERSLLFHKFMTNVPDPQAISLLIDRKINLTPEEIVEKALTYKPIVIPPYEER